MTKCQKSATSFCKWLKKCEKLRITKKNSLFPKSDAKSDKNFGSFFSSVEKGKRLQNLTKRSVRGNSVPIIEKSVITSTFNNVIMTILTFLQLHFVGQKYSCYTRLHIRGAHYFIDFDG